MDMNFRGPLEVAPSPAPRLTTFAPELDTPTPALGTSLGALELAVGLLAVVLFPPVAVVVSLPRLVGGLEGVAAAFRTQISLFF
jgi:hypothetical protein